ncbi:MAG: imidazoleglycerol-phosphate dehydratase HisB [Coriobacteriales bacterium]|nr:imidazoleglycerol-phosphate dehydratase HisB [Actinomycetes bacterium]
MTRRASITRTTSETDVSVSVDLDGSGRAVVDTGVPFFDHMLDAWGRHSLIDLEVHATGDLAVDAHHTVEDTGIVLGTAVASALGDKAGIRRFGSAVVAMDEALMLAAVDVSGRGRLFYDVSVPIEFIGSFDTTLAKEFLTAFSMTAGITVHVYAFSGENAHHIIEAVFKAVARALREAVEIDPRADGVPSTKGSL